MEKKHYKIEVTARGDFTLSTTLELDGSAVDAANIIENKIGIGSELMEGWKRRLFNSGIKILGTKVTEIKQPKYLPVTIPVYIEAITPSDDNLRYSLATFLRLMKVDHDDATVIIEDWLHGRSEHDAIYLLRTTEDLDNYYLALEKKKNSMWNSEFIFKNETRVP